METRVTIADTRALTDHHDGLGLNDRIDIFTDAPDPNAGGAAHRYTCAMRSGDPVEPIIPARLQFQHGPRLEKGSSPGITEAVLLVILIDRLRGFQAGPFACRENAIILTKLEECLHWTRARAEARHKRGVLGKNEK